MVVPYGNPYCLIYWRLPQNCFELVCRILGTSSNCYFYLGSGELRTCGRTVLSTFPFLQATYITSPAQKQQACEHKGRSRKSQRETHYPMRLVKVTINFKKGATTRLQSPEATLLDIERNVGIFPFEGGRHSCS